jgi:hypothetical protein
MATSTGIKFVQLAQGEASVWNIPHGMGSNPVVEVAILVDGKYQKAFPVSIVHVDTNNVQVTWSQPRAGYVSLATTQA